MPAPPLSYYAKDSAPKRGASIEDPNTPLTGATLSEVGNTWPSSSGQRVTVKRALQLSPVYQAVRMISGDVAKMPLEVFKRLPEKGPNAKEIDAGHPAFRACCREANEKQHAFRVWSRAMTHALIWNSGYVWMRGFGTRQFRIYNLLPDRTWYDQKSELFFTEINGDVQALYPSEVLHIEGLAMGEGAFELELIKQARDSWGVGLSMMDFKSKFYKNYGHAGGYLEIPAHFTEPAAANLEEGFRKRQSSGPDNWFKTVVLRDGAKFHQATVDPEKQQLSEATEDMAIEVARWFNLQPSRLGVRSAVSYGSKSEDNQSYFDQTLSHWTCAIQTECYIKMLSTAEKQADSHMFRHDIRALVATNPKTQADIDAVDIASGKITINEARSNSGMNPVEGGDNRILPMNHYIVDEAGNIKTPGILETEHDTPADPDSAPNLEPSETAPAEQMASATLQRAIETELTKIRQRIRKENSRKTPDNLLEWWDRSKDGIRSAYLVALESPVGVVAYFQGKRSDKVLNVAEGPIDKLFEAVERCFSQPADKVSLEIQTVLAN